jgi:hypothetical protein
MEKQIISIVNGVVNKDGVLYLLPKVEDIIFNDKESPLKIQGGFSFKASEKTAN